MEEQHDTFRKLIKSIKYIFKKDIPTYIRLGRFPEMSAHIKMFYPLVVLQGELLEAFEDAGELHLESKKHIVFKQNIVIDETEKTYFIDVITEDYLPEYLKIIEMETETIVKSLSSNEVVFMESLKGAIKTIQDSIPVVGLDAEFDIVKTNAYLVKHE